MVADQDGVVAVPLDRAEEVARRLKEVERKEAEAEAKIKRGEKLKFWDPAAFEGRIRHVE
jgi:regulator of RNase E activity RraA